MTDTLEQRLIALARGLGGALLAIDTSGPTACVCRVDWRLGAVDEESIAASAQPSESVARSLADAARATPDAVKRLRAIVIGVGPGSFTGLRVGLALAKGMAYAGHVPLYGVSSLATLAASQEGPGIIAMCFEARRGEAFAAIYEVTSDGVGALVQDHLTTPERFASVLRRYPGAHLVGDVAVGGLSSIASKPMRVARSLLLVSERLRRGQQDDIAGLVPSYLKVSEAERTTV